MLRSFLMIALVGLVSSTSSDYYTPCAESNTRPCSFGTNITDRLLALKKGGSNVLSTSDYDSAFFPCEEYNFNCGYIEKPANFLTVADGVQLNLTYTQFCNFVSDTTIRSLVKPYLGSQGSSAQCVSSVFPLQLSDIQCNSILTGYLNRLVTNLSTIYNSNKASYALSWVDVNINIKTAVIEMAKYYMNTNFLGGTFWNNFLFNNWELMSNELKNTNQANSCPECLHSSYLIDSVTTRCNKYQSINFLVDQSGSIGAGPFQYAKDFLYAYVNQTYDDLSLMSIHYYDSTFDPSIYYGNNRAAILSMIQAKAYRGLGTYTGSAINSSVNLINAANYPNGVPKLLVILTDGGSYDSVVQSADYARSLGITLFCVGIGANVNSAQLLQIAGTASNIVYISSYSSLSKLVNLIQNYFCKQIMDLDLGQTIYGNVVRVPTSPSYFRVARSLTANQYYKLTINYQTDPQPCGETVRQSHFDPFPDNFSVFAKSESYRTSILIKEYYISPQSAQNIPVKKTFTISQIPDHAFISVAGTSMNFNISLATCSTLNCTVQRRLASSIGSQNADSNSDLSGDNNINPSIFLPIGIALGALGLCTFGTILGLRKFAEAPQQQMPLNHEEQPLQGENIKGKGHSQHQPREDQQPHDEDIRSKKKSIEKKSNSRQRNNQQQFA